VRYEEWRWSRIAYHCQEGQIFLCWFTGFDETIFFKEMRVTLANECLENDYSMNRRVQCRIRLAS